MYCRHAGQATFRGVAPRVAPRVAPTFGRTCITITLRRSTAECRCGAAVRGEAHLTSGASAPTFGRGEYYQLAAHNRPKSVPPTDLRTAQPARSA
jgi:hypothetical protein